MKLFLDLEDPGDGNVIAGTVGGPTDPTFALWSRSRVGARAAGDRKPSVRRVRVADQDALLVTLRDPEAREDVGQRQMYLPGEREFRLLGYTYSMEDSAESRDRAFEEFRNSIRVAPT